MKAIEQVTPFQISLTDLQVLLKQQEFRNCDSCSNYKSNAASDVVKDGVSVCALEMTFY
jgi:hypothetical protein